MAKLRLKSENQILGDMASIMLSLTGVNDLNPGSVLLSLLQAASQEDFQQYYQMLQIVRNYNIDTTTGSDLDNRAFDYGLTRSAASRSTGKIQILREDGFVKISTTHFIGFRSRISGDTELLLNNAELFPSTGTNTLILGRGTPNEEEVTYTGSVTNPENNTNYYKIALDSPVTNDHALDETVILKQGVEVIVPSGTVIIVPSSGRSAEIRFTTVRQVSILAGEDLVDDVDIKAADAGILGNVGVNSITGTGAFTNPIFPGQRALNDSAFSNGTDKETDTLLRSRIKSAIQAISQSTKAGISDAISGLVDPATAKRLVSSNIILPDNVGLPVKIYIDDGTGFEPTTDQQGSEVIIESANGGESRLQLDLFPLVKAQVETGTAEPYDMSTNGLTLTINVGTETETLTFFTSDFAIPEAAISEEIAAAINNTSNLIEARTSQVGKRVVINAKADDSEEIQVTGGTANTVDRLNFPTSEVFTFYLYKNDQLLSKDGATAFVNAINTTYDFSGIDRDLSITVDGKTANTQTATIKQSDFGSAALAAQATAAQISVIINSQIAGALASDANGVVRLTSNTTLSNLSKIKVNTSDANTILGFPTAEIVGSNKDYTLNPELGIIELITPLSANDKLTSGSGSTRAFLTSTIAGDYSFAGGETLEINVDASTTQVIVFPAITTQTPTQIAALINNDLVGATAVIRTFGSNTFLEIRTNTLLQGVGSIEILSTSTANTLFGFITDTVLTNQDPHTASQLAQTSGPYNFIEDQTLVVVLDNAPTSKTSVITMDFDTTITSGTSTTIFAASGITATFPDVDSLVDYYAVFKSGANTITGTVIDVTSPTVGNYRYTYDTPPVNFEDFAIADQVSFSDMTESGNDGNFLVADIVTQNIVHAPVLDRDLDSPLSLTPSLGDRYLISPTANTVINSGDIITQTISIPNTISPSVGDKYIVGVGAGLGFLDPVLNILPSSTLAVATHGFRYIIDRSTVLTFPDVLQIANDPSVLTPVSGDRYLVGTTPVSAWAGQPNYRALYNSGDPALSGSWSLTPPSFNEEVLVISGGLTYFYDGTSWDINEWVSHDNQIAEYNGVGTPGWVYTTPNDDDVAVNLDTGLPYRFDLGAGSWGGNLWGGRTGSVAEFNGAIWIFSVAADNEVRNILDEALRYQYDLGSNTWIQNDWGGDANKIAEWDGAAWVLTTPILEDVVDVTDETITLQYNGTVWLAFQFWVEVANTTGVLETGSTGTGLVGQRRLISTYNSSTGSITLAAASRATATGGDALVVLPSTRQNVNDFFNNSQITSLSSQAEVSLAGAGQMIQIASLLQGSDGYVQVTGGRANEQLLFSTSLLQGVQGYNFYIGLIKLVHRTVYGDDTDLVSFPGVGAAGIKFQILPPTVQEVPISLQVSLSEGVSLSQVENSIKTEVISYVNNLGVSDEVILSNIVDRVVTLSTLRDVKITTPTANVPISENELARTKASLISVEVI